ncbi:MAG: putative Zn-dependent protease [Hyphomicrobiales bacterium]|nr:putative Zn-dependent protease [Hyphomicrobiales bacterium]
MTSLQRFKAGLRSALFLVALVPMSGCVGFGSDVSVTQTGANPAPLVPDSSDPDAAIGLRENPRIIASYGGLYSDRPAEVMIAGIVGRLMEAANQPNEKYTVTILDTADVNAFALPGGYIYVTRGILALANDSSEIAAVLAHEMAHVILKHARARANRVRTNEIVDKVVSGIFGADPNSGAIAQRTKLSFAAFSQAQELAADKEGIAISGKAGFDPFAAARFLGTMGRFQKYSAGDASQADDFLSSHPSTPDRIQKAIETARGSFGAPGIGEQNRDGYMAGIEGMTFGSSPAQGSIIGQRYVQPMLKLTFTVPEGYKLQNASGAVVGVAGDGEAVRFDSAEVPPSMALTDYLKSGWIAGLEPGTVTSQTVNGIETATGVAITDQWSFRVSVMRVDDQVYRFIFAAKSDSARFAKGAEATLKSFRRADNRDFGQIRKVTIRLVTARTGDNADTLARQMASFTKGTELFYVLNNLLPGDPVTVGAKYKVISVQ